MKVETAVVASVVEAVNRSGEAHVWRTNAGYMHIVGCSKDGRFVGFDVKVAGTRTARELSDRQAATRARILAAGGIAAEVTGATDAIRVLRDSPTVRPS